MPCRVTRTRACSASLLSGLTRARTRAATLSSSYSSLKITRWHLQRSAFSPESTIPISIVSAEYALTSLRTNGAQPYRSERFCYPFKLFYRLQTQTTRSTTKQPTCGNDPRRARSRLRRSGHGNTPNRRKHVHSCGNFHLSVLLRRLSIATIMYFSSPVSCSSKNLVRPANDYIASACEKSGVATTRCLETSLGVFHCTQSSVAE
jgi:hypothetical protein